MRKRIIHLSLTVEVPYDVGEHDVEAALNEALDEPPCEWGEWTVGGVTIDQVLVVEDEDEDEDGLDPEWGDEDYLDDDIQFADPGGRSALRAASKDNLRNLPCPTCGEPDMLTPEDMARGYQCDPCADKAERGGW